MAYERPINDMIMEKKKTIGKMEIIRLVRYPQKGKNSHIIKREIVEYTCE